MTSDEEGMVRSLLVDPWDELSRSAYADWLEERGDVLHAELDRLSPSSPDLMGRAAAEDGRIAHLAEQARAGLKSGFVEYRLEGGLFWATVQMKAFLTKAFQSAGPAWLRRHHVAHLFVNGATKDWAR